MDRKGWSIYEDVASGTRADSEAGLGTAVRLPTETVEERRARLIGDGTTGSRAWRRFNVAALVVLAVSVGVFFGIVPGSAAVGRYPVWDLYALEARIDTMPGPVSNCGPGHPTETEARVDLLSGRIVVDASYLRLSDDERAMVSFTDVEEAAASDLRATRVAVGAPTICSM